MWQAIADFFKGDSVPKRVIVHATIILSFMFAVWIAAHFFKKRGMEFAEQWQSDLNPITCSSDSKARDLAAPSVSLSAIAPQPPYTTPKMTSTTSGASGATETVPLIAIELVPLRLNGQFHQLQQRLDHHFNQFATYYSWSFASTVMMGVLAAIAAVTLLFITLSGWGPSHQYQKTIFLVATVTATYAAAFPSIFQLDRNVEGNRDAYLSYVSLADEMCSYPWTEKTIDGAATDPLAFVNHVDTELRKLNKIVVGFDAAKTPDFGDVINRQLGRGNTSVPQGNAGKGRPSRKATSPQSNKQSSELRVPERP